MGNKQGRGEEGLARVSTYGKTEERNAGAPRV